MNDRWRATAFGALLIGGCAPANPDLVYDVYSQAYLNPETFDEYVRAELMPVADQLLTCIEQIQTSLVTGHVNAVSHCEALPSEYHRECTNTDEAKLSRALSDIQWTVAGSGRWAETLSGGSARVSKEMLPEFYLQLQHEAIPAFRIILTCQ